MSEALAPTESAPAHLSPSITTGPRGLVDIIRLRPSGVAPSVARNRVRVLCKAHELPDHVVRDVAFVVGELVAISIRQARAALDVGICIGRTEVTVRIHEVEAGRFAQSRPDAVGTSQSLQLVQCVAQAWGISSTDGERELWATIARQRNPD